MSCTPTDAEVSERLQSLESEHDLLQYEVDGWCAWPMLRLAVANALQKLSYNRKSVPASRKKVWRGALRDVAHAMSPRRARYVVKTFSTAHTEDVSGRRKDVYFDDLLLQIGDYYKIETLNSDWCFEDGVEYLVPRDLSTTAIDGIARRLARIPRPLARVAARISAAIGSGLGTNQFTPEVVGRHLATSKAQKDEYRWLLSKIRPRHVFLADGGEFPLIAAARELGIEAIEFQHGFAYRHYLENSWTSYAAPYKARMPIANRIFLYGNHWKDEMAYNGFWSSELTPVGSIRVDRYRALGARRANDECTVVLTTQGIETDRVIAFMLDFARLATGKLRVRVHIKMHPVYDTNVDTYEAALRGHDNVQVELGHHSASTFDLLARAHLHVSISSTCHFEALALGVPTIVLPFATNEAGPAELPGCVFRPASPQELLEIALRFRSYEIPQSVRDQYFMHNAMQNIIRELDTDRSGLPTIRESAANDRRVRGANDA